MLPRILWLPLAASRRNKASGDALIEMRQSVIAFVVALLLFQSVLGSIGTEHGLRAVPGWGVAAIGLALVQTLLVAPFMASKSSLDCSSPTKLAAAYRTRFFMQVAFVESGAMFGFVSFFVGNIAWAYPITMLIAFFGFARLAPSRRNLARDQERLSAKGCRLSLVRALRGLDTETAN